MPDKIQPLDLLLLELLKDLYDDCEKLPLIGNSHISKDIATLRLNLLDHLKQLPSVATSDAINSSSGSLLITEGATVKLVQEDSSLSQTYSFSNYPVKFVDEVHLKLSLSDAIFLVLKDSSRDPGIAPLYERLASDFNGQSVLISYVDALGAI